ncbi:MAG: efflux RND transporter permease subunit [Bacteroidota bacterium]
MVEFLLKRPVSVLTMTAVCVVLGLVGTRLIPISLLPDVEIPKITVKISYPDHTSREIEDVIVRPLRSQLSQLTRLKDIESTSTDGSAIFKLSFEYGTSIKLSFLEVNEKIDGALGSLPRDMKRPEVIKASASDIPALKLAIFLDSASTQRSSFLELSELVEKVIRKRIEQLPEVAIADLNGLMEPQVVVEPDRNLLRALGIKEGKIKEAIIANNQPLGNLLVQEGAYRYNFKLANQLKDIEDIENIPLKIDGRMLKLKDICHVTLKAKKQLGSAFYNQQQAILVSIIKNSDTRVYDLYEHVHTLTEEFKEAYPALDFEVYQDQTRILILSIQSLISSLILGTLLATLILFLFLKKISNAIIIAISIPTSVLVSLFFIFLFDFTLNIISLSGLILGVGLMIDNSIVVIDNISRKIRLNYALIEACTQGTYEVITPLISSVLTTCSVFFPLVLLSGIVGALFLEQAAVVGIGLIVSLLVSILVIPVLYYYFQTRISYNLSFNINEWSSKVYGLGYEFFSRKNWILAVISIFFVLIALIIGLRLEKTQFPILNQTEAEIRIDWNRDISLRENEVRILSILKMVNDVTAVVELGKSQNLIMYDKQREVNEAFIYLKAPINRVLRESIQIIQQKLDQTFAEAKVYVSPPKDLFQQIFGEEKAPVELRLTSSYNPYSPPIDTFLVLQEDLEGYLQANTGLRKVLSLQINQENMILYGINYELLKSELQSVFQQNEIDKIKYANKFIPINLGYEPEDIRQSLQKILIQSESDSSLIPITSLIMVKNTVDYKKLMGNRNGEYLTFSRDSLLTLEEWQLIEEKLDRHSSIEYEFGGSQTDTQGLIKELTGIFFIAVILLYLILSSQFGSLLLPWIILIELPIDIGASLLFLWIFGETINIMSIIGMVVMAGIVINDSILKIHAINELYRNGMGLVEAIKTGSKNRLNAILMTTLTTILALVPVLFMGGMGNELQRPLAIALMGGLCVGTFISLYLIPFMYYYIFRSRVIKN